MIIQILSQIVLAIIFLVLSLIIFTGLGVGLLRLLKLKFDHFIDRFVVTTTVGLCLFTLTANILAFVNLRFLMWTLPIAGLILLTRYYKELITIGGKLKYLWVFLLVLLIGIVAQVAVNAPSGLIHPDGIYFYSSHGHDGVWHLALMEEMHKNVFPFQNPELAGQKLQNYHFFVDLLMSEMTRLFPFSPLDVYFRFMPILFSLLLGLSSFVLVKKWAKSESAGIWAMFFTYFAGSFGYLLTIPRAQNVVGETIFWVSQTQSVLGNPPHAAAFIILTVFLYCLYDFLHSYSVKYFILATLLGGVVIEFKVYAGVLILGGLLVIGVWELIFRKVKKTLLLFTSTLGLALLIYLPNSANSQDFLIWQPWWFIRTMVVAPDRLNWMDLELKRQTYLAEHNYKRVIYVESIAFFAFLFGNLGMRFIGFWAIFQQLRQNVFKDSFNLFFLSITTASFIIPVLFVQKGVAWNAIQFNQYFLLLFGFLAAITASYAVKAINPKVGKYLLIIIMVILTVPTQIGLLWQFYRNAPLSKISQEEIAAMNFLKSRGTGDDIILTPNFNKYATAQFKTPPIPIYSWYDTGYLAAFTGKRTLLSDAEQVGIMGYPEDNIIESRNKIFSGPEFKPETFKADPIIINDFLLKNNINYVYLVYDQNFLAPVEKLDLEEIYRTDNVRIYQYKFRQQ